MVMVMNVMLILPWKLIEKNVDYQRVLKVFCLNQVRTFCRGSTIFHRLTFKVDELQSVVKMILAEKVCSANMSSKQAIL